MNGFEKLRQKQSEMSDKELADLADKQIDNLVKKGDKAITMNVPPEITDTDLLLCELVRRFRIAKHIEKNS